VNRYRTLPRSLGALALLLVAAACAPRSDLIDVRGQPVPTAVFLFFDKDAAEPQMESRPALNEAAAFLLQYENTVARIVGHVAADEAAPTAQAGRIDTRRATTVGAELMRRGVRPDRIQALSAGRSENMAPTLADADIDRRVDILFGVQ
jgi:outer membrane protein OmpA-like peptidoglycan-associated protein